MSNHRMRVFSTKFKEDVVRRLESGEALAAVSKELGIARELLYEWHWDYGDTLLSPFSRRVESCCARPAGPKVFC